MGAKLDEMGRLPGGVHRVSLGFAIGTAIAFLPPIGVKTILSMALARLFRGNMIAAAIGVALHQLLLPLAPVILLWEFRLGEWILGRTGGEDFVIAAFEKGFTEWLNWAVLIRFEVPMLIGGAVIGMPIGIVAYFLARAFLNAKIVRVKTQDDQ